MLAPDVNRLDYGAQLAPPSGFELNSAIATTYSLDLNTLLAVPVALCFHDTLDGDLKGEKLALLEAIGQLKGKLKVFYQKGNIKLPPTFNRLFTLLEPCLHPVVPEGGEYSSFHPKLWLLRFTEIEPATKKPKVRYRLLILSRNLTFDRSWDVAVSLDGELVSKNVITQVNRDDSKQWVEFIKGLLDTDSSFEPAKDMKAELEKIQWRAPERFSDVKIHIGGGKYGRPIAIEKTNNNEIMVVSPFIKSTGGGTGALNMLASYASDGDKYLFSRAEELNAIGARRLEGWDCYAINENVVNGEERNEVVNTSLGEIDSVQDLHAKMIIQQQGAKAYWHLGSANATSAAIGDLDSSKVRNIETMVSMEGLASKVGPKHIREQWMPKKGIQLFVEHKFQEVIAEENRASEKLLRQSIHRLISADWQLVGVQDQVTALFSLDLSVKLAEPLADNVTVTVEQLAITGTHQLAETMCWKNVELMKISTFVPVTVVVNCGVESIEKNLLIEANLDLGGDDIRHQQIMKVLIDTPDKVLNYLHLLLQVHPDKNQWFSFDRKGGRGSDAFVPGNPILEQLLLASSRHPRLLKRIDNSLNRLKAADVDIPEEFLSIWKHFEKEVG